MKYLFALPGFAGGALAYATSPDEVYWVNLKALLKHGGNDLRLDDQGDGPYPGGKFIGPARELVPLDSFNSDYNKMVDRLVEDLPDYKILGVAFDWRKDLLLSGNYLAREIIQRVRPAEPCSIVAHSTGGLVARVAYSVLKGAGKENLIRRIVTLGTPHTGTYKAVLCLANLDPWIKSTFKWLAPVDEFGRFDDPPSEFGAILMRSFPSTYQLLPQLYKGYATFDSQRVNFYDPLWWNRGFDVNGFHVREAGRAWQTVITNEDNYPPPHVLTCVAGLGFQTAKRIDPSNHDDTTRMLNFIEWTDGGDGVVHIDSALVEGSRTYVTNCAHDSLPRHDWVLNNLADMIREERSPVQPVPPPEEQTPPFRAFYDPPPSYVGFPQTPPMRRHPRPIGDP